MTRVSKASNTISKTRNGRGIKVRNFLGVFEDLKLEFVLKGSNPNNLIRFHLSYKECSTIIVNESKHAATGTSKFRILFAAQVDTWPSIQTAPGHRIECMVC